MGIVPSSAAAHRGASGAGLVTVIVQPPDFSVADRYYRCEEYGPERSAASQSKFVAIRLCSDDDAVRLPSGSLVTSGLSKAAEWMAAHAEPPRLCGRGNGGSTHGVIRTAWVMSFKLHGHVQSAHWGESRREGA